MASSSSSSYITAKQVQVVAHSLDIPRVSDEAARLLAPDVEYRLREVIQDALKFAHRARRLVLTGADVDAALSARGLEPLYGAAGAGANAAAGAANAANGGFSAAAFLRAAGHLDLYYSVDRDVPLEAAIEAPLPRVPRDAGVAFHWLAVQGRQPVTADNAPCFQSEYLLRSKRRQQAAAAAAAVAAAGGSAADVAAAAAAVAAVEGGGGVGGGGSGNGGVGGGSSGNGGGSGQGGVGGATGGSGNGGLMTLAGGPDAAAAAAAAFRLLPRPGAAGTARDLALPSSAVVPALAQQQQQEAAAAAAAAAAQPPTSSSAVAIVPPIRHTVPRELQVYFDRVAAMLDDASEADSAADSAAAAVATTAAAAASASAAAAAMAANNQKAAAAIRQSAPSEKHKKQLDEALAQARKKQASCAAVLRAALASLSSDPGLHPLAPYFCALVAEGVASAVATDARRVGRLLELAGALLSNAHINLEPYLPQLLPAIMTALLTRRIGAPPMAAGAGATTGAGGAAAAGSSSTNPSLPAASQTARAARASEGGDPCHWAVRDHAARLVALAAKGRYGAPHLGVRPRAARLLARAFADPGKASLGLGTKYGAIKGLAALGPEAVRAVLVPHCEALVTGTLLPRMRAAGGGGEAGAATAATGGVAGRDAAAAAAAASADAWRVYAALRDAIADTMRAWFERLAAERVEGVRALAGGADGGGDDEDGAKAAALAAGAAARAVALTAAGGGAAGAGGGGGDMDVDEEGRAAAASAAAAAAAATVKAAAPPLSAENRAALARAWRDDADPRAVLDALVALFGSEAMLAAMPGVELPGVFL